MYKYRPESELGLLSQLFFQKGQIIIIFLYQSV